MENIQNPQHEHTEELQIDIKELLVALKKNKLWIAFSALLFGVLGAFNALNTPNEYNSTIQLLPELETQSGSGGMSKLKSLAGLAGVDLSSMNSSEAIRPDLYPSIVQSTPFMLEVLKAQVFAKETGKFQSVYDYMIFTSKKGFFASDDKKDDDEEKIVLKKGQIASETMLLDKKQSRIVKDLQSRISASIDKKSGVISLTAKMQDPVAAANLVTFSQNYLTKYVVNYRTEKARKELVFLGKRAEEAKKRYDDALFRFSNYKDRNRSVFLNVVKDEEKKMQYEVDLSYNLFSELSRQLEEAKIKLHKETPIFKVLEPAVVPLKKSEPKRSIIVLGAIFLGAFLSSLIILIRNIDFGKLIQ